MRLGKRSLVLVYHCLGNVAARDDPAALVVRPDRFRSQVESLRARGYEFVTASAFAERLAGPTPPEGLCALTFDDGSADNALVLPRLLEALGVPATLFICPGLLGRPHPWLAPAAGVRIMTLEELVATAAHPLVEIGSHTMRHPDLSTTGDEEAYSEMLESREALEGVLGHAVRVFAYPFGRYSAACPTAAERAGYSYAFAGENGAWRRYELRREGVPRWDGRATFALRSRGLLDPLLTSGPGRLARHVLRRTVRVSRRQRSGLPREESEREI